MRFRNSLFNQLASGKGGSILEPGDGELVVPAVLQACAEVPGPISQPTLGSGLQENSFFDDLSSFITGASGGTLITSGLTLKAGLWVLRGTFEGFFAGTAQTGRIRAMFCEAAALNFATLATMWLANATPQHVTVEVTRVIHIIKDGYLCQLLCPATVAGDTLGMNFAYQMNRIA